MPSSPYYDFSDALFASGKSYAADLPKEILNRNLDRLRARSGRELVKGAFRDAILSRVSATPAIVVGPIELVLQSQDNPLADPGALSSVSRYFWRSHVVEIEGYGPAANTVKLYWTASGEAPTSTNSVDLSFVMPANIGYAAEQTRVLRDDLIGLRRRRMQEPTIADSPAPPTCDLWVELTGNGTTAVVVTNLHVYEEVLDP